MAAAVLIPPSYNNVTFTTGGISVDLAMGTVEGDASTDADTLRSIEGVQGTNFADTFDASGFGNVDHLDPAAIQCRQLRYRRTISREWAATTPLQGTAIP